MLDPAKRQLTRIGTAEHLVEPLRAEVEALGFEIQESDAVAVHVGANLEEALELALRLRTALHVSWLLKRFRCPSPKALYVHAHAFPWEQLIPNDGYLTVVSHVDHPSIDNAMYPNLVLKDAIVDRLTKETGRRPDSGPDRSGVVVQLAWKGDRAWLYLNVNGTRLSDRGYRRLPHRAPMQETLAAGVLMTLGYDGTQPLLTPMCGSGTLAIEGALIATGRAPGLLRPDFGVRHTRLHDEDAWQALRRRVKKDARTGDVPPIVATDHDPQAIEAARRNARTAGVEQLIEFAVCDFADSPVPSEPGIVVTNPEYGSRLGDEAELAATYKRLGDFMKQRCPGWTGGIFTGSRELAKRVGLRAERRVPFWNGRIDCRLLEYRLYAGSR